VTRDECLDAAADVFARALARINAGIPSDEEALDTAQQSARHQDKWRRASGTARQA
jgi:hypothetical protein